ncbi:sigma-54-dependent Fis family transcriptional regulator [Methylopila sp. 73B]|uniref:sigma-54-dependent Fis family transcriptional regulator n=1 Tax=Methylopila sp. 73B TaxID=1120792 RepID=UPI00035D8C13|nr:sigma-54-dependent Fis family transcriptional regulator [Methylopila sp. 73B]
MRQDPPRADVIQARHDFFDLGAAPTGLVPGAILRSWQRCAARGFDSHERPRLEPGLASELRELKERNERLIRLSRPELESLTREAAASGGIVILTDGAGFVLDALGDPAFAGKAANVALRPGVPWSEATAGTNAIGAALVERRAVQVRGPEHYFEPHRILSCAAAPILDPYGALVGALDLTGQAALPHDRALTLVRSCVDQIEHRMFAEAFPKAEVIRLHSDPERLGVAQEGVLVFEGSRLVAANRHGLKLMGLDWNALGARSFGDLFDGGPKGEGELSLLRSRDGRDFHARLRRAPAATPGGGPKAPPAPAPYPVSAPQPRRASGPVFDAQTERDLARAARLVDGDVPVLIQGETGSGKEVFAREVHRLSRRADRPFVAVNCAALPEGLIEAELFGYEEGAFTGARRAGSKGLMREADGGVLFLDEIGDMPLALQARLLRAVQERTVTPLGGGKPHPIDVRLVSATHRDLKTMTEAGEFRPDLYYRIAQYGFALPAFRALADRAGALAALWENVAQDGRTLAPATLARLAAYDWPGNHREAVGAMRAMAALSEPGERIGPELLPAAIRDVTPAPAAPVPPEGLEGLARAAMRAAIEAADGNVAEAARRLGVSRSTLYRRAVPGGPRRRRLDG